MYAEVLGSRIEKISKTSRLSRLRMPCAWITHPDFLRALKAKAAAACYRLAESEAEIFKTIREAAQGSGPNFDETKLRVVEICLSKIQSSCASWSPKWNEGPNKSTRSVFDNPKRLEYVLKALLELQTNAWPTQEPFTLAAEWSDTKMRFVKVEYDPTQTSDSDWSQSPSERSPGIQTQAKSHQKCEMAISEKEASGVNDFQDQPDDVDRSGSDIESQSLNRTAPLDKRMQIPLDAENNDAEDHSYDGNRCRERAARSVGKEDPSYQSVKDRAGPTDVESANIIDSRQSAEQQEQSPKDRVRNAQESDQDQEEHSGNRCGESAARSAGNEDPSDQSVKDRTSPTDVESANIIDSPESAEQQEQSPKDRVRNAQESNQEEHQEEPSGAGTNDVERANIIDSPESAEQQEKSPKDPVGNAQEFNEDQDSKYPVRGNYSAKRRRETESDSEDPVNDVTASQEGKVSDRTPARKEKADGDQNRQRVKRRRQTERLTASESDKIIVLDDSDDETQKPMNVPLKKLTKICASILTFDEGTCEPDAAKEMLKRLQSYLTEHSEV